MGSSYDGHLPRNVVACAERLSLSDSRKAGEFTGLMMEAEGLARRAAALRCQAWALYRTEMGAVSDGEAH